MKNPPHPGQSILYACIKPLNMSIETAAKKLHITPQQLTHLINGKTHITPKIATHLHQTFGGTPHIWQRLQTNWNLAQTKQNQPQPPKTHQTNPNPTK